MEFQVKNNNSLQTNSTTSNTSREEHKIPVKKLKYTKAIKSELSLIIRKFCLYVYHA